MRLLPHPFLARSLAAAVLLALGSAGAQARVNWSVDLNLGLPFPGYYNGPVYAGPGYGVPAYGSVYSALPVGAVSISVGGGRYWRHGGVYYRPWGPRWVVVAPPIVVGAAVPIVQAVPPEPPPPAVPPTPSRPDPVIYPRNGQSAEQTEADRQDCNRWATTQPAALADASVFQRAVEACMDGRGYTMK